MTRFESLRVMVVDDMATSRELITQALDEIGVVDYSTESCPKNAYAALVRKPSHLVLCDYNMPGMTGLQLLDALRRSPSTKNIGFILVTGKPSKQMISEAMRLKLNNLIKKPFSPLEMKKSITAVVGFSIS